MNKNQAFLGKNLNIMKHLFLKIENKYSIKSRLAAEKLSHNQPDPGMSKPALLYKFLSNFFAKWNSIRKLVDRLVFCVPKNGKLFDKFVSCATKNRNGLTGSFMIVP